MMTFLSNNPAKRILCNMAILLFIALLGADTACAQAKFIKLTALKIEFTGSYDDNILRYSSRDIERFQNRREYYPSKLSTYDDWQNDFRLKFYFAGPKALNSPPEIWYFGKFSQYCNNPFNNYSTHTLIINQKLSKSFSLKLRYFYMPDFYLREYKDRDLNQYHSCRFDDHQAGAGLNFRWNQRIELSLFAEFEQIYYNKYFTEYDSELWSGNAGINYRFNPDWRFLLDLGYTQSDNIGYKSLISAGGVTPNEDTEYGDSSYDEEIYQAEIRYRKRNLFGGKDVWFSLQYKLRHRIYTTDNHLLADPYHSSRSDDRQRIIFTLSRKLTAKLEGAFSYTREWRITHSDYAPVEEVKNFTQDIFSLDLTYSIY